MFPISRDPPEGGTIRTTASQFLPFLLFPISRDPPEGGTRMRWSTPRGAGKGFPISRDPPEGGTPRMEYEGFSEQHCFQFLGIPPKGERLADLTYPPYTQVYVSNF